MERLTKRVSNNRGHLARCHIYGNRCAEKCTECVDLGDALYKLAEYEDTGLTPKEIGELKSQRDAALGMSNTLVNQNVELEERIAVLERALELACEIHMTKEFVVEFNKDRTTKELSEALKEYAAEEIAEEDETDE